MAPALTDDQRAAIVDRIRLGEDTARISHLEDVSERQVRGSKLYKKRRKREEEEDKLLALKNYTLAYIVTFDDGVPFEQDTRLRYT